MNLANIEAIKSFVLLTVRMLKPELYDDVLLGFQAIEEGFMVSQDFTRLTADVAILLANVKANKEVLS